MFFTSRFKWERPSLMATITSKPSFNNRLQIPILPSIEASLAKQNKNNSPTDKQPPNKQQVKIAEQRVEEKPIIEQKQEADDLLDQQLMNHPQKLLRKIISIMKEISMLRNGKTDKYVQLNNSLKHYQSLKAEADYKAIASKHAQP